MYREFAHGLRVRVISERNKAGTIMRLCAHIVVKDVTVSVAYIPDHNHWELAVWDEDEYILSPTRL